MNHSIKVKSTKVVNPNMTLLESFKTMNIQHDNRMNIWKKETMSKFEAEPTWTDRTTAKLLTLRYVIVKLLKVLLRRVTIYARLYLVTINLEKFI